SASPPGFPSSVHSCLSWPRGRSRSVALDTRSLLRCTRPSFDSTPHGSREGLSRIGPELICTQEFILSCERCEVGGSGFDEVSKQCRYGSVWLRVAVLNELVLRPIGVQMKEQLVAIPAVLGTWRIQRELCQGGHV